MYEKNPRILWKKFNNFTEQEEFVLNVLKEKKNGYFVELGSGHPQLNNNTYNLEKKYDWNGLALDIDFDCVNIYNNYRKTKCLQENAISFDYRKFFFENSFPKQIDYLQIDIDDIPRYANLKALISLPLSEYRFSIITIEHDTIRDFTLSEMRNCQRLILNSFGYDLVVQGKIEDWWIDKSYIPYKNYSNLFRID